MTFIEKMKMQAKQDIKTIVLPESEDIRTIEATEIVLKEGFANKDNERLKEFLSKTKDK